MERKHKSALLDSIDRGVASVEHNATENSERKPLNVSKLEGVTCRFVALLEYPRAFMALRC